MAYRCARCAECASSLPQTPSCRRAPFALRMTALRQPFGEARDADTQRLPEFQSLVAELTLLLDGAAGMESA